MKQQGGFTIIEVILFLGISGLLTISLLIGISTAIQRQQYKDSVQSFANYLRGQYSAVINVQNDRQTGKCPISSADVGAETNRGQSSCVIVGRYISTVGAENNTDGREYSSRPVYAYKVRSDWIYKTGDATEYTVDWGTKTKFSNQAKNSAHIAILMYRHPETGQLIIRTNSGRYGSDVTNFINNKNSVGGNYAASTQLQQREICVYDDGWLRNERLSVFLAAYPGSADAISVGLAREGCRNV